MVLPGLAWLIILFRLPLTWSVFLPVYLSHDLGRTLSAGQSLAVHPEPSAVTQPTRPFPGLALARAKPGAPREAAPCPLPSAGQRSTPAPSSPAGAFPGWGSPR